MPFGVEASSPSEDQSINLDLATTEPDDEVPAAAHDPGFFREMPIVRKGSGRLSALVLHLPPSLGGVVGIGRQPPRGDFRGGVLAVSQRRTIPS